MSHRAPYGVRQLPRGGPNPPPDEHSPPPDGCTATMSPTAENDQLPGR